MKISRSTKGIIIIGIVFIFVVISGLVINLKFEKNRRGNSITVYNTSVSNGTLKVIDTPFVEDVVSIDESVEEVLSAGSNVEIVEYVYDGMTMNELADKLERNLKSNLSGKGYLYASYSLEKGVDPYLAVAISLHETGCNSGTCSSLVRNNNNVGGMRAAGTWKSFDTLDDGIRAFIDNIARNYVSYGLTDADSMASKYAGSTTWASKVNYYINKIKNS